ncbi:hypothetical protein V565_137250 [Rhizoctonia solani 123E]|uniref:Uncharacterized protein n=1 Tax=Rhizoctonia solani 123E TaxID=1423351 RepID=A0A074RRN7_9AGAM|nr:hypothetical protein V565_137250 [Rhizoctonia solani 123E]
MSNEQGTLNVGSGNDEWHSLGTPVFLVVEHNGRKVAIGRNPNYQETIASIKRNVHEFQTTPIEQVTILAFLKEVEDHVQIAEEVWGKLLPRFLTIRVELGNVSRCYPVSPGTWNKVGDESPPDIVTQRPVEWTSSSCAQTTGNEHGSNDDDKVPTRREVQQDQQQEATLDSSGLLSFLVEQRRTQFAARAHLPAAPAPLIGSWAPLVPLVRPAVVGRRAREAVITSCRPPHLLSAHQPDYQHP